MTPASAMLDTALLLPMTAHVALAATLYVLLTIARAPAIWGIARRADGSNPFASLEPRIGANLSNQFEWPLFFHVACVLLMLQRGRSPLMCVRNLNYVTWRRRKNLLKRTSIAA